MPSLNKQRVVPLLLVAWLHASCRVAVEAGISAAEAPAGNLADQRRRGLQALSDRSNVHGSSGRLAQTVQAQGVFTNWLVLFKRDQRDAREAVTKLINHVKEFRQDLTGGNSDTNSSDSNTTWAGNPPPPPMMPDNNNNTDGGNITSGDGTGGDGWDADPETFVADHIGQEMDTDGIASGGDLGPGVKGLVLDANAVDDTMLQAVEASEDMVLIPDFPLTIEIRRMAGDGPLITDTVTAAATKQQVACNGPLPAQLSTGIQGSLPASFWGQTFGGLACTTGDTRLMFVAELCGTSNNQILYRAVFAVNKKTNKVKTYGLLQQRPCILKRDDLRQSAKWNLQRFGACGVAPTASKESKAMPTTACVDSPAVNCLRTIGGAPIVANMFVKTGMKTRTPVKCNKTSKTQFSMEGVSCGPDNRFIRWTKAVADDGCILEPNSTDPKFTADMFGLGCGTPPALATNPLQTQQCVGRRNLPLIDPPRMPKSPRRPWEVVPEGIARIEAFHPDEGITDMATFRRLDTEDKEVKVAVIDSGIDADHPDLDVAIELGKSFGIVEACEGDIDWGKDCLGHGTHVAGTVGAKPRISNQAGLLGVAPGVTLVPLKVMNGKGEGALSSLLQAMDYLLRNLVDANVKVVVVSLSFYQDPDTYYFEQTKKTVCQAFEDASARGIVVVAAAGNYERDIKGYFPACCPTVLAVTAINDDTNEPAPFTNYLPDTAEQLEKSMVLAAPGTNVNSTFPKSLTPTGYFALSGTSVAAPHVAGVAASCIMCGACSSGMTGKDKVAVMQAAAAQRLTFDPFDFYDYSYRGDPSSIQNNKYFGNLVWDKY